MSESVRPKFGVVVLTMGNRPDDLKRGLVSLLNQQEVDLDVVVVGTVKAIMKPEWERAVRLGEVETLGRLLAAGADINSRDRHDQTALMIAAHAGLRGAHVGHPGNPGTRISAHIPQPKTEKQQVNPPRQPRTANHEPSQVRDIAAARRCLGLGCPGRHRFECSSR